MPDQLTDYTANQTLAAADLDFDNDLIESSFDAVGPYVVTGLVPSAGTGLSVDVTAGTALIGLLVTKGAGFTIGSLAASNTNHLYLLQDGTATSNTTGTAPADSVKLGTALTDGTGVLSVDTSVGSGRQTKPTPTGILTRNIANKTANYTALTTDSVLTVDASGGAVTITLPTASGNTGLVYDIKRTNSGANNVTIDASGAELIDGSLTYVLTAQYQNLSIISTGTGWAVL